MSNSNHSLLFFSSWPASLVGRSLYIIHSVLIWDQIHILTFARYSFYIQGCRVYRTSGEPVLNHYPFIHMGWHFILLASYDFFNFLYVIKSVPQSRKWERGLFVVRSVYVLVYFHDHKIPDRVFRPDHPFSFLERVISKPSFCNVFFKFYHLRALHEEVHKGLFRFGTEGALCVLLVSEFLIICVGIN